MSSKPTGAYLGLIYFFVTILGIGMMCCVIAVLYKALLVDDSENDESIELPPQTEASVVIVDDSIELGTINITAVPVAYNVPKVYKVTSGELYLPTTAAFIYDSDVETGRSSSSTV